MAKAEPTIRSLAREAGVSRTTVSLALRNHPRIPKRLECASRASRSGEVTV